MFATHSLRTLTRRIAMALRGMRNLYVMDLVKLSLAPAVAGAVRTRGGRRVDRKAAATSARPENCSRAPSVSPRPDGVAYPGTSAFRKHRAGNPRLTEAAVLKALSKEKVGDSS